MRNRLVWRSRIVVLLLTVCLSSAGEYVVRDDDHRLGPAPPGRRYCVGATTDNKFLRFHCSENPIDTLGLSLGRSYDGLGEDEISIGVPQRIDGTDAEQDAIREILRKMDNYFHNEVLSMPEYANIRTRCKNRNELCSYWAAVGECDSNRIFMLPNCAPSCRLCLLLHTQLGK